jgi:hypothetical protein
VISRTEEYASAKKVEVRAPIAHALEEFGPGHVAFDLA